MVNIHLKCAMNGRLQETRLQEVILRPSKPSNPCTRKGSKIDDSKQKPILQCQDSVLSVSERKSIPDSGLTEWPVIDHQPRR